MDDMYLPAPADPAALTELLTETRRLLAAANERRRRWCVAWERAERVFAEARALIAESRSRHDDALQIAAERLELALRALGEDRPPRSVRS